MTNKRNNSDLKLKSIWDEPTLFTLFDEYDKPTLNAIKIWRWMISHPEAELEEVPMVKWSVPAAIEKGIRERFVKLTSKVITRQDSERDDTVKLLIELQDGHHIETVIMKHQGRVTVCVSSQIGCKMGCKFCATGTMGIIGDLTSGEIIEQLIHASQIAKVRNVVFMGMGEPLNNYENVKLAVQFMTDTRRFSLSPRHVTVSTVGVVNNMYRMSRELPDISLALSLHAPTQDIRLKIVPAASAHPIEKLMDAVDNHISCRLASNPANGKKEMLVMIEYILIKDVNDRLEHAHQIGALLASRRDHIILNVIPYNPTDVAEDFHPPTEEQIEIFFRTCANPPYLLHTRRRREMGQDIDGACGQLAVVHKDKEGSGKTGGDIEDMAAAGSRNKGNNKLEKLSKNGAYGNASARAIDIGNMFGRRTMCNAAIVLTMLAYHPLLKLLSAEATPSISI